MSFFRWSLAFLLVLLLPGGAWAEPFSSPDPDTSLAHFPSKIGEDLPHLFSDDNLIPFAVGSLAAILDGVTLDGRNALAGDLQDWNAQPLFDLGNFYGQGWVEGGGAVGSWVLGGLTSDKRMQEFGRDACESLLTSTVLVTGLKYAVGRERPDHSNHLSFPSGHSIVAFCFAPVVAKYGGWQLGVPAYAMATLTAFARVEGYHHYLSDVIAGATLGILVGNAVVYAPKGLSVSAFPGGMTVTVRF